MGSAVTGVKMKVCPHLQETLWLDVYGELDADARPAWEQHLKSCTGCREERQRLLRLLQRIREEMPPPDLSPDEARALSWSIKRGLNNLEATNWWRKGILFRPNRLVPALAAACLLIVALGWFTMHEFQMPSTFRSILGFDSKEQTIVKDLEVIKNLELLEEMDTLEKLVQVVDQKDVI
jgi:hypothetical protein